MANCSTVTSIVHHVRSATLADDSDLELPRSDDDDSSDCSQQGELPDCPTSSDTATAPGHASSSHVLSHSATATQTHCLPRVDIAGAAGPRHPGAGPTSRGTASAPVIPPSASHRRHVSMGGLQASAPPTGREHRRNFSADPDYELPQGTLTETKVLMAMGGSIHLDHFGFLVSPDSTAAAAGRTAGGTEVRGTTSTSGPPHSSSASAADSERQRLREERRVRKWRKMLGAGGRDFSAFASKNPLKLKRRARKGIPEEMRGLAWQLLSGGRQLMLANPGKYVALQQAGVPMDVDSAILRDLHRTFPNHILFIERQGIGQHSLYYVLRAYAAYDLQVGYVQGMGFVVAVLVMYMTDEEAFWTLMALMHGGTHPPLEGLYTAGMPTLQLCLFQFQALLKEELPSLAAHMAAECLDPALYATCWFNTIFAYTLPAALLVRVWDVFMLEGMRVVFRVGLAILKLSEAKLAAASFETLAGMLGAKALPALVPSPDELFKVALRISLTKRLQRIKGDFDEQHKHGLPTQCSFHRRDPVNSQLTQGLPTGS